MVLYRKFHFLFRNADRNGISCLHPALQDLLCQSILHLGLNGPFQRACSVLFIKTGFRDQLFRRWPYFQCDIQLLRRGFSVKKKNLLYFFIFLLTNLQEGHIMNI